MENDFVIFSAYLNIFAGVALLVYWYTFAIFMPYGELSTTLAILVKHRHWLWINALGVLPGIAGILLAVGAPTFGLGSMFGKCQVYPRSVGVTLMGVALIWIGFGILGQIKYLLL